MTTYKCHIGTKSGAVNPFNENVSANSKAEAEAAMKSKYPDKDNIYCTSISGPGNQKTPGH